MLALTAGLALALVAPAVGLAQETPPPASAPPPTGCVSGPIAFGLIQATSGCFEQTAPNQWQSSSQSVTINGLPLPPLPGTKLTLTGPTPSSPGGELSVQTSLTVAGVTFAKGPASTSMFGENRVTTANGAPASMGASETRPLP